MINPTFLLQKDKAFAVISNMVICTVSGFLQCSVGLYRTSHPIWKSGKFSKSGLCKNRTFSFPDAGLLKLLKIEKKIKTLFSNFFFIFFYFFNEKKFQSDGFQWNSVISRVTIVNFTVTRSSLQSQCLNQVLKAERPDIDQKRSDLLKLQGIFFSFFI